MQGLQRFVPDMDCLRARAGAVRRAQQKPSWRQHPCLTALARRPTSRHCVPAPKPLTVEGTAFDAAACWRANDSTLVASVPQHRHFFGGNCLRRGMPHAPDDGALAVRHIGHRTGRPPMPFCAIKPADVPRGWVFVFSSSAYSALKCPYGHDLGRCFPKIYQKSNESKQKCDQERTYLRFLSKT